MSLPTGLYPAWIPHDPSPTPAGHNGDRTIKGHWLDSGAILGPGEGIVQAQEWVGEREGLQASQSPVEERRGKGRQRPLLSPHAYPEKHTHTHTRALLSLGEANKLNRCGRMDRVGMLGVVLMSRTGIT